MGDRAVVVFKEEFESPDEWMADYSPGIYVHWEGSRIRELLEGSLPYLRLGDHLYSAARFCGYCHTQIPGNLGLGLYDIPDPPIDSDVDRWWDHWGPGDNGVFLVDVRSLKVTKPDRPWAEGFYLDMTRVGRS